MKAVLRQLWAHRHDPQNGWPVFAVLILGALLAPFLACLGA